VLTEMRRYCPRKTRNCYRDAIWVRALLRSWMRRLRLPDLDAAFLAAMEDDRR
jgi:hypothetical protein